MPFRFSQAAATGLEPKKPYVLALAQNREGTGMLEPLAAFMSNRAGAAVINSVGPIRQVVAADAAESRRYLVIAPGTPKTSGNRFRRRSSDEASVRE